MIAKICGITNRDDALAAVDGGAAALGFIFYRGSPRYIAPDQARAIIEALPAPVWKVGVFVDETPQAVAGLAAALGLDIAQLHGRETARAFPAGLRVWKALRIQSEVPDLDAYPAEAILLDGATSGQTFDWNLARIPGRRIIIAGGLDANNVREAIERAQPWGVDACSSLEREPGRKDHVKVAAFLRAALAAGR
jgi:phosphoribosylanthranilate isomerase